eukprot:153898_1
MHHLIFAVVLLIITTVVTTNGNPGFWNSSLRTQSDKLLTNFRAAIKGVIFSGVFTNNTILQREPYISALYGAADKSNTKVTLTINGKDSNGNAYNNVLSTNSYINGDWKILLNSPMKPGGNYTFNIACDSCNNPSIDDTLYNITFGDVYYCSGQSNMQLRMHYTFNRNHTYN